MSVNFTEFSVSITFYGDSYYILRCQILCYYYILRNYYILRCCHVSHITFFCYILRYFYILRCYILCYWYILHYCYILRCRILRSVLHFAFLLHFAAIVSHFAFFVTFRCNKS